MELYVPELLYYITTLSSIRYELSPKHLFPDDVYAAT